MRVERAMTMSEIPRKPTCSLRAQYTSSTVVLVLAAVLTIPWVSIEPWV